MKVLIILAVTIAVFGVSHAEDKKTQILNFYKCISCHENPAVTEDYKKCCEMKPEKCKKIAEECKKEIMPGIDTEAAEKEAICKNENEEREKLYECVMDNKKKDLTEEEKTQLKEFIQCAKKMDTKYCASP